MSARKLSFFSSPLMGEGGVGVIISRDFKAFHFDPPHPGPLPRGEREFPDENQLESVDKRMVSKKVVIPAKAGIQCFRDLLDAGSSPA